MRITVENEAQSIRIEHYNYPLPENRIANKPCTPRDACKLLICRPNAPLEDAIFHDIEHLLPEDNLLVLNDSRVIQARLHFRKPTGALIEIMLISPEEGLSIERALISKGQCRWRCLVGNAKRWQNGIVQLQLPNGDSIEATKFAEGTTVGCLVEFCWTGDYTFGGWLAMAGETPIPPYMRRRVMEEDKEWYQTVYANHSGSVAAPTAGLHFTQGLLNRIVSKGVKISYATLHVSAGTFLPVTSETLAGHSMHRESVVANKEFIQRLAHHQGSITVVGTTSLRTLESLYWLGVQWLQNSHDHEAKKNSHVEQWIGYNVEERDLPSRTQAMQALLQNIEHLEAPELQATTELLIAPGYKIRMADALITNFHQPESTLLLLVDAFMEKRGLWREAYQHALENGYNFLSYGDAMYIEREKL